MDRPEPAHAQQPRNALGIPAIGLDRHGLQNGLHLAGLHQDKLEARFAQAAVEPLRQRTGLEPDRLDGPRQVPQECDERLGLAVDLRPLHDLPMFVEHADCRARERNVDADEGFHAVLLWDVEAPAYPVLAAP